VQISNLFEDAESFASSFTIIESPKDQDGDMVMDDSAKRQESALADKAFINTVINFKAFNVDFESLKLFFQKADEHFKPFDSEEEPGKHLKQAIAKLTKQVITVFDNFASSDEIQDALLLASRSVFMLLQMEQLYEMDWFDTISEILEVLKRAQKKIL
jgi:hypothetical protein